MGEAGGLAAAPDGTIYYRGKTTLYILDSQGRVTGKVPVEPTLGWNLAFSNGVLQDGLTRRQADGSLLWEKAPPPNLKGAMTFLDAQGHILVLEVAQSPNRRLELRDPQGTERWRLNDIELFSFPAIGADGRICFIGRRIPGVEAALTCIGRK